MNERDIFLAAIEIADPTGRAAYLDQACADNAELRAQVEELLNTHNETSKFLETPAMATDSAVDRTVLTNSSDTDKDSGDERASGEVEFRKYLKSATRPGCMGRLAHYEIEEILGRGAFGIVAKAFDEKLHRVVAIKLMNPELASTSPPRKRFLREARTAAAVTHENIVAIHAVEEEPIPYLVMEYISGKTLQQRMDGHGPLAVPDVLQIGQRVASGLAAAHAAHLIHRDIKPSNILLSDGPNSRVKISDFGLARAVDDASMTKSGMIAGTPMYMAPEQARGETLDHRADLFSLGSVLYQMAGGRPPFRAANTVAVLKRVCEDTPRPLCDVLPGTPDWLEAIIFKLLEKDRDNRYQTAQEVADLLIRCQSELEHNGKVTCVEGHSGVAEAQVFQAKKSTGNGAQKKPLGWLLGAVIAVAVVIGLVLMNDGKEKPDSNSTATSASTTDNPTETNGLPADAPRPVSNQFVSNEWLEVIPLIDPQIDKVDIPRTGKNDWQIEDGELKVGSSDIKPYKLVLPVDSEFWPAFDVEIDVTLKSGSRGFNLNFPVHLGDTPLQFFPPTYGGVSLRDQNGVVIPMASNSGIQTGRRVKLRAEFRNDSQGDRINVWNGENLVATWNGNRSQLYAKKQEGYLHSRRLGLWIEEGTGEFVFHSIRIRSLKGSTATPLRAVRSVERTQSTADAPPSAIREFAAYEWIDLIPLIDPEQDRSNRWPGNWSIDDGKLIAGDAGDQPQRLFFPIDSIGPSVEVEIEVTRRKGTSGFIFSIPTADKNFPITFDRDGEPGLTVGDAWQQKISEQLTEAPLLETGQKTTLRFVLKSGKQPNQDVIYLWKDEDLIKLGQWNRNSSGLAMPRDAVELRVLRPILLVQPGSEFVFDRIRVKNLEGTAKTLRPVSRPPELPQFAAGSWIDVIPLIDPAEDIRITDADGRCIWQKENDTLTNVVNEKPSVLILPLDSAWKSYECELVVSSQDGKTAFTIHLPNSTSESGLLFWWSDNGRQFILDDPRPGGHRIPLVTDIPVDATKLFKFRFRVERQSGGDTVSVFLDDSDEPAARQKIDLELVSHPQARDTFDHTRRLNFYVYAGDDRLINKELKFHSIRVRMLEGDTARMVRPTAASGADVGLHTNATSNFQWPADAPPLAIAPFDAKQAQAHQEAWAAYLKVPVEYENSIGKKLRLIPPGEFLMGKSPNEVELGLQDAGKNASWRERVQSDGPQHKVVPTQPIYVSAF